MKILISSKAMDSENVKMMSYYIIKADGRLYYKTHFFFVLTRGNEFHENYIGNVDQIKELYNFLEENNHDDSVQ